MLLELFRRKALLPAGLSSQTLGASGSGACGVAQGFPLPIQLGSTQVSFNGIAAPLLAVTEHQINLIVPWELSGDLTFTAVGNSNVCVPCPAPWSYTNPRIEWANCWLNCGTSCPIAPWF